MGAVRTRFHAELRRRAFSLVLLSVLVGITGGAVVSLAAGARRTESAYRRFLDRSSPSDVWIQASDDFLGPGVDFEAVARLPQVLRAARGVILFTGGITPSGRTLTFGEISGIASSDGRWGQSVDRWSVLEGRLPDRRRVDEVVIGFDEAERLGAHAGDTIDLVFPTTIAFNDAAGASLARLSDAAAGRGRGIFDMDRALRGAARLRMKVVGIVAMPGAVPPFAGSITGAVHLTPAFYERHAADLARTGFMAVRIRSGASLAAFKTAVERLDGDALFLMSKPTQTKAVDRSLGLQATAVRIMGALVLLVAVLVFGQALARLTASESDDFPTLRALGMTRLELFLIGIARAFTIAVPAAGLCALTAVALSIFWPVGLAGTIEPVSGFAVDLLVIGAGCMVVFAATVLLAAWPAWQAAVSAGDPRRVPIEISPVARALNVGSRGFVAGLGARLALEPGRGRRAVPVRTAMAVGATAIAATAMAVGFSTSLSHLRDTPKLYGWAWDAQIGARGLPDFSMPLVTGLKTNPAVRAIAVGTVSNVSVNDTRVDALALDVVRGRLDPTVLEGRAPRADHEIALGTATMRDLGIENGDQVSVRVGAASTSLRLVGRAVFPNLGDAGQLGRGAAMSLTALEALDASATRNIVLVRFTPEASPGATRSRLRQALDPYPVTGPQRPDDLVSLGNVDGLAVALGLLLAALAAATLAHTLITSTRRRAADLAVLKALGVTRRQVGAVIGWQATALLVIAMAIGLPLGIAAARVGWDALAGQLGVPAEPTLNLAALALVALVVVLLGVVAASGPAIAAATKPPARVLREE
jgi:ABC-type lipoprotein release transport system permease subunit